MDEVPLSVGWTIKATGNLAVIWKRRGCFRNSRPANPTRTRQGPARPHARVLVANSFSHSDVARALVRPAELIPSARMRSDYFGAFGTGRVSPRSAGKRSSFGAWPVVALTFGGFAVFGASGSAGWCGSAVGGGTASILMPSPSVRGAGAFCAAATLALKSSAAKAREMFVMPWS
jgi:hypothetical protein